MKFEIDKVREIMEISNEIHDKVNNILYHYDVIAKKNIRNNEHFKYSYKVKNKLSKYIKNIQSFKIKGFDDGEYLFDELIVILKLEDSDYEDEEFKIPFDYLNKDSEELNFIINEEITEQVNEAVNEWYEINKKSEIKKINEVVQYLNDEDKNEVKEIFIKNGLLK